MKDSEIQACKCPNQYLLETGAICEVCFGVVQSPNLEDFPEAGQINPFEDLLFEELEMCGEAKQ